MRKDAHQQLLSFVSLNESWEDSLRSDPLNNYVQSTIIPNNNMNYNNDSKNKNITRKSPYETTVAPLSSRRSRSFTPSKKTRRSKSVG